MTGIIMIVHVFVSIMLIIIVLLQAGKGADMGAAFGGASQTVFGPSGAAGPLAKITVGAAVLFMLTSIYLTWASRPEGGASVIDQPSATAPATPGPAATPTAPMTPPAPGPGPTPGSKPLVVPPAPTGSEAPAPTFDIPAAPSPGEAPKPTESPPPPKTP